MPRRMPRAAPRLRRALGSPARVRFLILAMLIAIIGLVVLSTVFFTGLGLVTIFVGIFLLDRRALIARGFGTLELFRLRLGRPPRDRRAHLGAGTAATRASGDGVRAVAAQRPLLGVPAARHDRQPDRQHRDLQLTIVWLRSPRRARPAGSGGCSSRDDDRDVLAERVARRPVPARQHLAYDPAVGERTLEVLLAPDRSSPSRCRSCSGGLTLAPPRDRPRHARRAGAPRPRAPRSGQLAAARGAAVQAEDAALRRLERDIHDGPQQRLVRLQLDLAAIERRLDAGPGCRERSSLGEAREQATRGARRAARAVAAVAPPLLQDRGLAAALESLAARSPCRSSVEVDLRRMPRLPARSSGTRTSSSPNSSTNVVEALRAHRHPTARRHARCGPGAGHWLDVWVIDNGRGGAAPTPGHGLAGLDDRVAGLRGVLVSTAPRAGRPRSARTCRTCRSRHPDSGRHGAGVV